MPGVVAVGATNVAPFGPTLSMPFLIEGRPAPECRERSARDSSLAAGGQLLCRDRTFFSALGIPLLQGRDFGAHDWRIGRW